MIVTSQNRILDHEAVITDITEIAGDQEIGEIQCRSYNGGNARWVRPGYNIPTSPNSEDVYKSKDGLTVTLFVKKTSHISDDFYCTYTDTMKGWQHYINLYLSEDNSCKCIYRVTHIYNFVDIRKYMWYGLLIVYIQLTKTHRR